ncbi:MAG TPA: c-type cytochrome [Burkholderiales bacterium]|nr:c-type cytochrome [Burkholderiales bacterium]
MSSVRVILATTSLLACGLALAAGDVNRGARVFQACAACHSLEPGRHLTGPSLGGIWGRKAGTETDFRRYSEALKRSDIVWGETTLDRWVANPEGTVSGNLMRFQGLQDRQARADLVAFLHAASEGKAPAARQMRAFPQLKQAPPEAEIAAIRHCGDTYFVTNGKKETRPFWEFNLRFKTDSGPRGPEPGKPVMVGQGMQGDRAQIVFSTPQEISDFIKEGC